MAGVSGSGCWCGWVVSLGMSWLPGWGVLAGLRGMLERRAGCGGWSGGEGGVPAAVVQELAEVVDGAEEFDLGVGGVAAAVVEVAAEPGVELGERGLDQGGAAPVQLLAGRGGQPGGHLLPARGQG